MSKKERDREELKCLVDNITLDNWNAEFEKSENRLREGGAEFNITHQRVNNSNREARLLGNS